MDAVEAWDVKDRVTSAFGGLEAIDELAKILDCWFSAVSAGDCSAAGFGANKLLDEVFAPAGLAENRLVEADGEGPPV